MQHRRNFIAAMFNISSAGGLATAHHVWSQSGGNSAVGLLIATVAALNLASAAVGLGIVGWTNRPSSRPAIQTLDLSHRPKP